MSEKWCRLPEWSFFWSQFMIVCRMWGLGNLADVRFLDAYVYRLFVAVLYSVYWWTSLGKGSRITERSSLLQSIVECLRREETRCSMNSEFRQEKTERTGKSLGMGASKKVNGNEGGGTVKKINERMQWERWVSTLWSRHWKRIFQ